MKKKTEKTKISEKEIWKRSAEYERTIRELRKALQWAHVQAALWYGFFQSKCNSKGRKSFQKMLDKCAELTEQ